MLLKTNTNFCQQQPKTARKHIVDVTSNLIQAVNEVVPSATVVGLSTDLVFDGQNAPYREEHPAHPLSVYGQLKLQAEAPILALTRGIVLRTSLVYGQPATHKGSFLAWMVDHFSHNQSLSLFEDEVRTPVHVDDLCAAMSTMAINHQNRLVAYGWTRAAQSGGNWACSVCGLWV